MKYYWKYIKPYKLYFILGPILMLTEVAGEIVLPKMMSIMVADGVGEMAQGLGVGFILTRALIMLGFIALMITGGIGGHYFSIRASVYFSSDLRQGLFEKVQKIGRAHV